MPRVRDGSYFPSLLEPRERAERALVAVVREAYVQGVSTGRVDDLVKALGMDGISKSQVSRLCAELDAEVERFRGRRLEGPYPYVWLDATFVKVRRDGRVVSGAVVLAVGVRATGEREVLGLDVGPCEDGAFWTHFLRGLAARGLAGVQLVVSDAHGGLKGAVAAVLQGAAWQRCRTHFLRNALALVPKGAQALVAATIRTVFAQPEPALARETWRRVADGCRARYPKLAQLLDDAEDEGTRCWPPSPSRASTGATTGATTRSSDSTRRSSAERTWWASSPTRPRSSAWSGPSWPSSTTSGRSAGATWAPSPPPSSRRRSNAPPRSPRPPPPRRRACPPWVSGSCQATAAETLNAI